MQRFLKVFTIICIVGIFLAVILVSSIARFAVDSVRGMIDLVPNDIIRITSDGVSIADAIEIDGNGITIGGKRIDFSEIGESVADQLDSVGVKVDDGTIGGLTNAEDVTEAGFTQKRYAFDAAINRSLEIDVSRCDVVIAGGDTDRIIVDVLESDDFRYQFATSDNTLIIRDAAQKNKTMNIFGFELSLGRSAPLYSGLAMIVYLPADFSGEIALDTSDGEVKLGSLTIDEELSVGTSGGDIELYDISAHEIDAVTSGGRITLANLSATEISATTSGERITMSELTSKRLQAVTSSASIDFVRIFSEKLEFSTTMGDIDGSVLGSENLFSIVTTTDRSASPETRENARAQYSLRAVTSGGDINVRFVE